jgi:hypothetical protein
MSTKQEFFLGKNPHITVTCHGDCDIRSWVQSAVMVKGAEIEAIEGEETLSLVSHGDLRLMIPDTASLTVETAHGDLLVKNVVGSVSINNVHGDVILRGLQQVKVSAIMADLSAKHLNGTFSVEQIHGDAVFRHVGELHCDLVHGDISAHYVNGEFNVNHGMGDVSLLSINGDVRINRADRDVILRNLGGLNTVTNVAGDIRLRGGLTSGEHTFVAERDIIVRWPLSEPLNFVATAPRIVNRLPLDKELESDEQTLVGRIGDGKTEATFKSNGRILLKEGQLVREKWSSEADDLGDLDFTLQLEGLGEQINQQINEQMLRFSDQIETRFGPDFAQKISEKVAQKAEQAAARAEQAMERARQRAEREIERAARAQNRRRPGRPPAPPSPPSPKKKATTEEQMKILQMVEKGVITPGEAATLLAALEK